MTRYVTILYPDHRQVSEDTIKLWTSDSYYNNADWYKCMVCDGDMIREDTGCNHMESHGTPMYLNDDIMEPITLEDCINWLEDMGEVTFHK